MLRHIRCIGQKQRPAAVRRFECADLDGVFLSRGEAMLRTGHARRTNRAPMGKEVASLAAVKGDQRFMKTV